MGPIEKRKEKGNLKRRGLKSPHRVTLSQEEKHLNISLCLVSCTPTLLKYKSSFKEF
jgi:hypothetical protein